MDPWQALVLEGGLAERGASWAAFEVALTVTRQNGKGSVLEARELAGIELFGEKLIMHTAHELKTAEEARLRMEQICESSPDLDRQVKRIVRTNGKEAIEFKNGARIKYVARSTRSGRGFTGDVIVMDEDMFLSAESMAALIPTLATARNPQVWYTGSAGMAESTHKRHLRDRALAGNDPSLAYFEWSIPDDMKDYDDRAGWAIANPALGIRIFERFVENERATLAEEDFARERLGVWDKEGGDAVISEEAWAKVADPSSTLAEPAALALDINPERTVASIGAASRNGDRVHVEVLENRSGVAWVVERLANLHRDHKILGVAVDSGSPAGAMIPALEARDVPVVQVGAREYGQACGAFFDAVMEAGMVHRGQLDLAAAVQAGRRRTLGDAWAWHRRNAKADITPLVAATLAFHLCGKQDQSKPKLVRARGRGVGY